METANKRFKQVRLNNKLTQKEYADKLSLTLAQVNAIENDNQKLTYEISRKVQEVFGDDWTWLMSGQKNELPLNIINDNDVKEIISMYIKAREGNVQTGHDLKNRILGLLAAIEKQKNKP